MVNLVPEGHVHDLALEGRARYYNGAGAVRDMIQSHLLQIMALVAIEPPATDGERDLRDAVSTVLRASSIKVPYRNAETLAEVRVNIDNWRWKGKVSRSSFVPARPWGCSA